MPCATTVSATDACPEGFGAVSAVSCQDFVSELGRLPEWKRYKFSSECRRAKNVLYLDPGGNLN